MRGSARWRARSRTAAESRAATASIFALEVVRAAPDQRQIEPDRAQHDSTMVDLVHLIRRHEHLPAGHSCEQTGHGRILVLSETHDQIVDPTDLAAGRV